MNKSFIINLLNESSSIANEYFGKVADISMKSGDANQVLTQADEKISQLLFIAVQNAYPEHNIIDEESGIIDKKSEYTWVFDPIDGTSNYAAGLPTYGIIIGLLKNWKPLIGAIALPAFNEVYYAEKGKGTTLNDKPIHVTSNPDLNRALVSWGIDTHPEDPERVHKEMKILEDVIQSTLNFRSNNSAFDACMFFKGALGGYLHKDTKVWEVPTFQILAEEAGGVFTSFEGKKHDYSNIMIEEFGTRYTFCMAPSQFHPKLQEIIHKHT